MTRSIFLKYVYSKPEKTKPFLFRTDYDNQFQNFRDMKMFIVLVTMSHRQCQHWMCNTSFSYLAYVFFAESA